MYNRIIYSPHLSSELHQLHQTYISPKHLREELNSLRQRERIQRVWIIDQLDSRSDISVDRSLLHVEESVGYSMTGQPIICWTIGVPTLPRILCACQHHSPENLGASFSLYLSHLLLADPLFTSHLNHFSFTFFPQQNPDGLTVHQNQRWMNTPTWRSFVDFHQYDPREIDVEHGVPSSLIQRLEGSRSALYLQGERGESLQGEEPLRWNRPETQAFIEWVIKESEQYGPPIFYLSGHSWDILDAPLYLLYPSSAAAHSWIDEVHVWAQEAPYQSLAPRAPLTDDYMLPPFISRDQRGGVFRLPTRQTFREQNPKSDVQCSTMDVMYALNPSIKSVVVEPPIFTSPRFRVSSHRHNIDRHNMNESTQDLWSVLCSWTQLHQKMVRSLQKKLSAHPMYRQGVMCEQRAEAEVLWSADLFSADLFSADHQARHLARLALELKERDGVEQRWDQLIDRLTQSTLTSDVNIPDVSVGQRDLALCNQVFHVANLIALAQRIWPTDPELSPQIIHITPSNS